MKQLTVSLLLSVALLALVSTLDRSQYSHDYFSKVLADAGITTYVTIDDLMYKVDEGVVTANGKMISNQRSLAALKLAYEKTLAERSPLLGFPGVNPEKLSQAVLALQEHQRRLAESQANTLDAYLVRTALYPLRFLKSAALLEQARQNFITSGDAYDALRYQMMLAETSQAYRDDLKRFSAAFQRAVPTDTLPYGTVTKIIDRAGSLQALAHLSDEIAAVEISRRNRTLCILGITSHCTPQGLMVPRIQPTTQSTTPQKKGVSDDVKNLYKSAGFPLSDGPSVVLSNSSCVHGDTSQTFSFMRHGAPLVGKYVAPVYTGDLILVKSESYAKSFFYHYFSDKNVAYVLTDPLAYYECPTASFDLASTLSILHAVHFAETHELPPHLQPDVTASVMTLEKKLSSTDSVHENDVAAYLDTLLLQLSQTKEDATAYRELMDISLGLSYKTAGLTEYIGNLVEFENQNRAISQKGVDVNISTGNLFYLKSGFASLLHIPNNQNDDDFRSNTLPAKSQPYVYYSDLNHSSETRENITADLIFFRNLHLGI